MIDRVGHRGYIGSRRYFGDSAPQQVQNLVIRDYCARNEFTYFLSVTEYAMDACYIMLNHVVQEAPRLKGVVLYSLFMLPLIKSRRFGVYSAILGAGATLHAALEGVDISSSDDVERVEEIWNIKNLKHNN